MRLSHVNSAWIILCKFFAFNCAIFPNTNLLEIILPQSLDRFGAVVWNFFMVNWMDSLIERIRSIDMVKRECIGFIFIPSQISSFCGCQTDFLLILKPHWVKLFLTNSASSSATSIEEGGVVGGKATQKPSSEYAHIFIPSFLQIFCKNITVTYIELIQKHLCCPQNAA